MSIFKSTWLVLLVILLSGGVAQSQSKGGEEEARSTPGKKLRIVDGFRSAKFGMNEKQVRRAIINDFKVPNKFLTRNVDPKHKNIRLIFTVKDLIFKGGHTRIAYHLGHKSKRLIQVNLAWGKGVTTANKNNSKLIVSASRILSRYFKKQGFMKDKYLDDVQLKNGTIIMFRGQDKKGRMIILRLHSFDPKKPKETDENIFLLLSYIKDVNNPDLFQN